MPATDAALTEEVEFVTFRVSGQSYCLDITKVREIRRWGPVTSIPRAPVGVMGVMNLRGSVIPVYDLAARLGQAPAPENARNVIVVAMHASQTVGLLVEAVEQIISVGRDRIQETGGLHLEGSNQGIVGLIIIEESMTRVIDLTHVVHSQTAAAA